MWLTEPAPCGSSDRPRALFAVYKRRMSEKKPKTGDTVDKLPMAITELIAVEATARRKRAS